VKSTPIAPLFQKFSTPTPQFAAIMLLDRAKRFGLVRIAKEVCMRKAWKFVGIAVLVAVLGLGTVAVVAFAQGSTGTTGGPFNFYERFRTTLAGILGISVDQYNSAVTQARDQTLSDAVTEGWLTQNQADQMKQRMENAPDGMPGGGMGFGFGGRGHGMGGGGANLVSIAADKLGMTEADLRTALQGGKTIAALAQEKGVDTQTIVDAYIAKVSENLTQAVTDGRMTQKMADALVEQARTQVTDQLNATWQNFGPGEFGRGHWGGPLPPDVPSNNTGTDTSTNTDTK
jgi:hypothetical protein